VPEQAVSSSPALSPVEDGDASEESPGDSARCVENEDSKAEAALAGETSNAAPVNDPPNDAPPVNAPPVKDPPNDAPPVTNAPHDAPPVEPPHDNGQVATAILAVRPVNDPPNDAPPVNAPPVKDPPNDAPPVTDAPHDAPPVEPPGANEHAAACPPAWIDALFAARLDDPTTLVPFG
jgi:hypothetical protein